MAETAQHQRLIRALVAHARAKGVHVQYAAIPGFREPPVIAGRKPDLLGWVGDRPVVGEAELGPDLSWAHTQQQLASFASWQGPTGLRAVVALIVPSLWQQRARSAALAAGVDPARLVVVSLPVRVRRRRRPATAPQLLQRGTKRPVPAPGTLFQRRRTRSLTQAELNQRARQLALELVRRRVA